MYFFTRTNILGALFCCAASALLGQTTLINPATEGGFEQGGTFAANGWTEVNYASGSNNNWFVGNPTGASNVPSPTGSNCAYIALLTASNNWTYSTSTASVVHFYRDVTFPAGETNIVLTFKWKNNGESGWDRPLVFLSNSGSPSALVTGTPASSSSAPSLTNYTLISSTALSGTFAGWTTATITITAAQAGNTSANSSRRLVFTWQNDGSLGSQPPAAIDDISLISAAQTTYTWVGGSSGTYSTASNWSPARNVAFANDILQFNGGTSTVTGVSTQTIGAMRLMNSATVNLQGSTTTLTIGGTVGTDLDVPVGSTLNINGASSLNLTFSGTGNTASIDGTLGLSGSSSNTYTSSTSSTVVTTVTGAVNNFGVITGGTAALLFNSGSVYTHQYTTSNGAIPTATWNTGSKVLISGFTSNTNTVGGLGQTFSDFEWNCAGQTQNYSFGGSFPTINGTFTLGSTGSGSLRLGAGSTATLTCGNFTQTGGLLDLSSGSGSCTLKTTGTFNQTGGTITESGTGTACTLEFGGTSNQSVSSSGTISNIVSYRLNNAAGATVNSSLPVNSGASVTLAAGSFSGSGSFSYAGSNTLTYSGTAAQTTSGVELPATLTNVTSITINNVAGVTLHAERSFNGTLTLTAGLFRLDANNFTLGSSGTISVTTPGATKMVSTNGAGMLRKTINTGSFTFPIGEETSATEYTPFTINFSASSGVRVLGLRVVNATPPNNGTATNYLNRYWVVTDDLGGTYTYTATMTYAEADIVGPEASLGAQFYNGSSYSSISGTSINTATNVLTLPATNQASTLFDNSGTTALTGRVEPVACGVPYNLTVGSITGVSASLNWTEAGTATTWDIYYSTSNTTPSGGTTPSVTGATTKPYPLGSLTPLTTYYWWVRADCGGNGVSAWSASGTFSTICGTPVGGTTNAANTMVCPNGTSALSLTGNTTGSGISYQWQSSGNNTTYTNISGATSATYTATVTATTWYRCAVTCSGSTTDNSTPVQVNINGNPEPYCAPIFTTGCGSSDVINRVVLGTLDNSSSCSTCGYGNYTTGQSVPDLAQNTSVSVSVTVGNGGTEYVRIFIDFNQDGDFGDAGENTLLGSGNGSTVTANVAIPNTAMLGQTRMRVRLNYNSSSFSECASTTYGEAEDYTVNIVAPPACPTPGSLASSNLTGTTATLNWTENGSATLWDIYYSSSNTTPNAGTTPTINDTPTKPNTLTGLSGLTTYYAWVRSDCGGSGTSTWSGPVSFSTLIDCGSAEALNCGDSKTAALSGSGSWTGSSSIFCGYTTPGQEKLYSFSAPVSGSYTLGISAYTGSSYVDFMYKDASGACSTAGWTCINDINTSDVGASFTLSLTAGTTYWLLLDAESTSAQSVSFSLSCPAAMTLVSSTATQAVTTSVAAGTTNTQVIGLQIVTNGSLNPLTLTQLALNTNGSSSASTDLVNARIYSTGTSSTFATTTQFGSTVATPNGTFMINGSLALNGGATNTTNYLWLVYDLACGAINNNLIDAEWTAATIGGATVTPTTTAPSGARAVTGAFSPSYISVGSASATSGATNQQIVRLNVSGSASCAGVATNLTFNTANTTASGTDILKARVYYTSTTTFATTTPFGSEISNPAAGDLSFAGSQTLASAAGNYFWLVYDLSCTAVPGNSVNATAVNMTVSGTSYAAAGTTPTAKSIANPTSYTTIANGNWSDGATWGGCPVAGTAATITINHNVSLDTDATVDGLTVNSGKVLTINANTLTIGPSGGGNKTLSVSGTLLLGGGTLNLNGNAVFNSASTLTMSSGNFNIDGNGTSSVSAGTNLLQLNSSSVNLSGGTITFVDPHAFSSASSNFVLAYGGASVVSCTGGLIRLGDGISTAAGNATGGFNLSPANGALFRFYDLEVNGGSGATRFANNYWDMVVLNTMTININCEHRTADDVIITKNLVNNGIFTNNNSSYYLSFSGVSPTGSTTTATANPIGIYGIGVYRNATTSPTANLINLRFNTTNSNEITVPGQMITGMGTGSVSGTLDLTAGRLNLQSNTFTLGISTASTGTLMPSTPSSNGYMIGTMARWLSGTGNRWFPIGTTATTRFISINHTTTPTSGGLLTATFNAIDPGNTGLPVTHGGITVSLVSPTGYWNVTNSGVAGGSYTATVDASGFTKLDGSPITDLSNVRLIKRPDSGSWAAQGTATAPGNLASVALSGLSTFSDFAVGGTLAALPVELLAFDGVPDGPANRLDWITASEQNAAWFVVERSADGSADWREIGRTPAAGNTATERRYSLSDLQPLRRAYYRLRTVDVDGSEALSPIIVILRDNTPGFGLLAAYPSPTTDRLTLEFQTEHQTQITIQVTDLTGRSVLEWPLSTIPGLNTTTLPVHNLAAGCYLISVRGQGTVSAPLRFVKQ